MDRYAVFGNPIQHSRSPWIHTCFAKQTGQSLTYVAQLVEPQAFEKDVRLFFDEGGCGLNVTVPFKERAFLLAEHLIGTAATTGAVNTLFLGNDGRLCGANTDGVGLVRDLTVNLGISLAGKSLLVLGAGGAVRGVLPTLLAENPLSVCIANRTLERAQSIVASYPGAAGLQAVHDTTIPEKAFDVILNGSAAGLHGSMPAISSGLVGPYTVCYDMVYGKGDTVFQRWAKAAGAAMAVDGVGMLVEQAADAFALWRNVRPDTAPVIAKLREMLEVAT